MSKQILISLLVLALAAMLSVTMVAQQPDQNAGQNGEHRGEHMGGPRGGSMNSQAMLDHMTKELNLSSDQQTKIKTILDDGQKQAESIRSDSSLSQQDRMTKMRELHKSTMDQVKAQLTADQQTKFDEMQKKMMGGPGGHRGGPGGDHPHGDQSSTPPPPPQQ